MSTHSMNDQINQLIAANRIEEAKSILRTSSDPNAKRWLERLEDLYSPSPIITGSRAAIASTYQYHNLVGGRSRGWFLTIWIPVALLINGVLLLFLTSDWIVYRSQVEDALNLHGWGMPVIIILGLIVLRSLIGIWNWKAWWLIGYFLAQIALLIIFHIFLPFSVNKLAGEIGSVIHLIIFGLIFIGKFDHFE